MSLRAKAQPQLGNIPEGKTYLRTRTKNPFRGGFLHCVRTVVLTLVEMTSWTIDKFKAFPLGARRGGAKLRKNSPRVTVFSQSGEVAMLRAGRWHECERNETNYARYAAGRGRPALPTALPSISHVQTCHFDRSVSEVEKSPAIETKPSVYGRPEYLPAGAPCLARGGSSPRADSAPHGINNEKRLPGTKSEAFIICSYVRMRIYLHNSPCPAV